MAGSLHAARVRRNLFVRNFFLELAWIMIQIGLSLPKAYAQEDFLSIDCGSDNATYVDSNNLTWVTDNPMYMILGKTIQQPTAKGMSQALQSLRYFPEGRQKYCYVLPTPYLTHLLRAQFYIDASVLSSPQFSTFQFAVFVDATEWFTVSSGDENQSLLVVEEGIFHPPFESINICLRPQVGLPFISSLELRAVSDEYTYSYDGSIQQYLSVIFRYNLGATSPAPDLRYPDDIFDRIWTTPDAAWDDQCPVRSLSVAPDINITSDSYYVPPNVMKDAWLFQNDSVCANGVIFPVYGNGPAYMTPASFFFVAMYIEYLNVSDSELYYEYIDVDTGYTLQDAEAGSNLNHTPSVLVLEYHSLEGNYITFQPKVDSDYYPSGGPSMNAVEMFGQYDYNFSFTNFQDQNVIAALQIGFSLTDWQGDPCTPVPHDWLNCNFLGVTLRNLQQPCVNLSYSGVCNNSKADLQTTYYVTSINLFNCTTHGFRYINASNQPPLPLYNISTLSITNTKLDNATVLNTVISYASPGLSALDLRYNSIGKLPQAKDWANLTNLLSLNLAHNNLTGVLNTFDNITFSNTLVELNLSNNAFTSFPAKWTSTTEKLEVLDLSHNNFQGNISSLDMWVQINSQSLMELDISDNQLSGAFSSDLYFSGLPKLNSANFDDNFIQGVLNLSLWYEALLVANNAYHKNLTKSEEGSTVSSAAISKLFSFVNNNISGIYPDAKDFDSIIRRLLHHTNNSFSAKGVLLGGNPYCKSPKSHIQQYLCRSSITDIIEVSKLKGNKKTQSLSSQDAKKDKHSRLVLVISICSGIGGLLFLSVISTILWKLWKQVYALREIQQALLDRKVQPPFFQYSDIKSATRDFHNKNNKLGHGGFGIVYKGVLADGTMVAVKKLFNLHRGQVLDEFLNEVVLITGIKHKNLIQLKGCCINDKQRLLVYEFAEKGNLAEALWGARTDGKLNWDQRFKICRGIAQGLSYLHEELQPPIIHRDVKPENILLDMNFEPKIADFGLARHIDDTNHARSTKIAGTLGYFAPEYVMQGQLSEKVDVYSYGVLILEVVSGRKCIDSSRPSDEKFLRDWVYNMRAKKRLFDVLQPELRDNCVMEDVLRTINIGLLCVQHEPEWRPTMSQVVTMFLGSMDIKGFSDQSDGIHPGFKKILETMGHDFDYPTLQSIEEDSTVVPLLDLDSPISNTSSNNSSYTSTSTSRGPTSKSHVIELGPLRGR